MTEHSSKQYDIDLETLRSRVLEMGGLVEAQILAAINGLTSGDLRALEAVVAEDHHVNALEVSIDTGAPWYTIDRIRIAVNGAAARPLRLKAVEDAVRGKPATAATGEMAGRLAVQGAVPLQFNAYKIPLMRNLVKRAIGGVEEARWAS